MQKKKKYRVWAQSITDVYLDVEAESEEEAKEIAEVTDGGDFQYTVWGDWIFGSIECLSNEKETPR